MDASGVFTYDSSLPTARDRIRHFLGDTDPLEPLRFDETYDALLSEYGDETEVTLVLARAFTTQFGRQPTSISIPGGPSVGYSDRVKSWAELAKVLASAVGSGTTGGTSYVESKLSRGEMSDGEAVGEYYRDSAWYTG